MTRLRFFRPDHPVLSLRQANSIDRTLRFWRIERQRRFLLSVFGGNEEMLELFLAMEGGDTANRVAGRHGIHRKTAKERHRRGDRLLHRIATTVKAAERHWLDQGGFTIDARTAQDVPIPADRAAVSLRGFEVTVTADGDGRILAIALYIAELWRPLNGKFAGFPVYLGGSTTDDRLLLDLTIVVPREEALYWCAKQNQRGYFSDGYTYPNPFFDQLDDTGLSRRAA